VSKIKGNVVLKKVITKFFPTWENLHKRVNSIGELEADGTTF